MIHIYCGDGKGKTTAAIGLAVRCAGAEKKVLFYQFMKTGTSSEIAVLSQIPYITVLRGYTLHTFSFYMTDAEKKAAAVAYEKQFAELIAQAQKEDYEVLVLDEIFSCISCGFLSLNPVLSFLKTAPAQMEIVMTGRNPDAQLMQCADYISEIEKRRHPYDLGISARKGIEY